MTDIDTTGKRRAAVNRAPWPEITPPHTWRRNERVNSRLIWVMIPLFILCVFLMKHFEAAYDMYTMYDVELQKEVVHYRLAKGQEGRLMAQRLCMLAITAMVLVTIGNALRGGISLALTREIQYLRPKKTAPNDDGGLTVLRCVSFHQRISFPDDVDGVPITGMAKGLLKGNRAVAWVHLPEGLTAIPEKMFQGCDNLPAIVIPPQVTAIGPKAFAGCRDLEEIYLPPSVAEIAPDAFAGCEKVVMHVREGSAAEAYAREHAHTSTYQ